MPSMITRPPPMLAPIPPAVSIRVGEANEDPRCGREGNRNRLAPGKVALGVHPTERQQTKARDACSDKTACSGVAFEGFGYSEHIVELPGSKPGEDRSPINHHVVGIRAAPIATIRIEWVRSIVTQLKLPSCRLNPRDLAGDFLPGLTGLLDLFFPGLHAPLHSLLPAVLDRNSRLANGPKHLA